MKLAHHEARLFSNWPTLEDFLLFLQIFGHSIGLFGVRRGFKMILSHRAPSSLDMSSYRAIKVVGGGRKVVEGGGKMVLGP